MGLEQQAELFACRAPAVRSYLASTLNFAVDNTEVSLLRQPPVTAKDLSLSCAAARPQLRNDNSQVR